MSSLAPPPDVAAQWLRRFRGFAYATAAVSIAIGTTIWISYWWLKIPGFTAAIPFGFVMTANSAVALALGGAALGCWLRGWRIPAYTAAALVTAIGAITLGEYAVDASSSAFDLSLSPGYSSAQKFAHPGRMRMIAALDLTLLGSALILLIAGKLASLRQALAALVSVIAFIAFYGSVMGLPFEEGFAIARNIQMSWGTALLQLALGLSIILAAPLGGWAKIMVSARAGGRVARVFLPVSILAVAGLAALMRWLAANADASPLYLLQVSIGLVAICAAALVFAIAMRVERIDAARARVLAELDTRVQTATEELARSNARISALISSAPDAVFTVNPDLTIASMNPAGAAMFGYADEMLLGTPLIRLLPAANGWTQLPRPPASGSARAAIAAVGRRADGTEFPLELALGSFDADGVRLTSFIGRDMTESVAAAEALRASDERFRTAFSEAPIGVALVSLDGRWLQVNRSLADMLGYTQDQLLATDFQSVTHPADLRKDVEHLARLADGEIDMYQIEKRYITKQGGIVWGSLSVAMIRDASGRPDYVISHVQDVTESKLTIRELRRSNRDLEQFAHIVSHDLRAPLGTALTFHDLLMTSLSESHQLTEQQAQFAYHSSTQMLMLNRVIDDILTYSRAGSAGDPEASADLRDVCLEALAMLTAAVSASDAEVVCAIPPGIRVRANDGQVRQVLANLVQNSLTYRCEERAPRIRIEASRRFDATIVTTVTDNGIGIAPKFQERVFDMLSRLSVKTSGTGLGLALVKRIVEASNGTVSLRSDGHSGTAVTFTLPAAPVAIAIPEPAAERNGGERAGSGGSTSASPSDPTHPRP